MSKVNFHLSNDVNGEKLLKKPLPDARFLTYFSVSKIQMR